MYLYYNQHDINVFQILSVLFFTKVCRYCTEVKVVMLNDVQVVADAAAGSDCESVHTEILL